jgi:hypothetical protein
MFTRASRCLAILLLGLPGISLTLTSGAETQRVVTIRANDVVAFVGAGDTAAAGFTGHLESLFAVHSPGTRFRNFGWEGDTVFEQRRDVGFPALPDHLKRAGATVVFLQFGRAEALSGTKSVQEFYAAYERLVSACLPQTARIVLVTPPPFERTSSLTPDLSARNAQLAVRCNAVRTLARNRSLWLVDLFAALGGTNSHPIPLTENGLQLSAQGHALVAAAYLREMGAIDLAAQPGEASPTGAWANPKFEALRQVAIEKHQLWFHYWRPQNWAFLGGDRITQPSSRDHRDPKVRWFPAEMEKYPPLIQAREADMEKLAAQIRGGMK